MINRLLRACASNLLDCLDNHHNVVDENGFSKSQLDNLYFYYSQCENQEDPVGGVIDLYRSINP